MIVLPNEIIVVYKNTLFSLLFFKGEMPADLKETV
jgi:hypothetical protein